MVCCKSDIISVTNGHLECLKQSLTRNNALKCLYIAAKKNYTKCLKYIKNKYIRKWDRRIIILAVSYGSLDCLKYIHDTWTSNKYIWNRHSLFCAAHYGHLDIIKYMHKTGCELYHDLYSKRTDIMEYICQNR